MMQGKFQIKIPLLFALIVLIAACTVGCGCDHIYSFDCDQSCDLCGESREGAAHTYSAECDPTCDVCEETRVASEHAYDSDSECTDITCKKCGFVNKQEHAYERTEYTPSTLLAIGHEALKCTKCSDAFEEDIPVKTPENLGMPAVYITDFSDTRISLSKLTKPMGEIYVHFSYKSSSSDIESFDGTAKIKVQGESSTAFPKKNFSIKLYQDETFAKDKKLKVDLGWGKENKYCLKANWTDFSHAKNIVSAQLFSELVRSRKTPNENLLNAPNCGVIDGFPVLLYLNGEFHGLYTLNIPKDKWAFAMDGDETTKEALLMADDWSRSVSLREEISDAPLEEQGWELEYASTEDTDISWVKNSFNELIRLLNCGDNAKIKRELHEHLDIEAAIDNMIFTYFINGADSTSKNILWATYDGEVWIPSMYDMDMSYGTKWDGLPLETSMYPSLDGYGKYQGTWEKQQMYPVLIECFPDAVEERWNDLREDILTLENLKSYFDAFYAKVPMEVYDADKARWENSGSWLYCFYYENHTNYYELTEAQLKRLDRFFDNFN